VNRKVIGALVIMSMGVLMVVAWKFAKPLLKERAEIQSSDAKQLKGKLKVAVDSWIGYFPLVSSEMKNGMRIAGWSLECEDDKADYATRMKRLRDGEFQFVVATVDSYILNAVPVNFPGLIVAVIDESRGGDAILARKSVVDNINAIKGKTNLRVAFTPGSPSHHLLKVTAAHFDVREILPVGEGRIETNGSTEALNKLMTSKADIAVVWEPDVSKGLANGGIVKILGTEKTQKVIVDILVVNKDFAKRNPEAVETLLSTYFRTLKFYREQPDKLRVEIVKTTNANHDDVDSMLKGVVWFGLMENCERWFGIAQPGVRSENGLIETIDSTVKILQASGDFSSNPLPSSDPYRLTQSDYLEKLFSKGAAGFTTVGSGGEIDQAGSLEAKFSQLTEGQWNALKEVGSLKSLQIAFQSGASDLSLQGRADLDQMVETLKHYPQFRVVVKGHTGTSGDKEENKRLSQERTESVARYLMVTYNIDQNRLRALGMGSEQPLPKQPGESERAYNYRLPRVEISLVSEVF